MTTIRERIETRWRTDDNRPAHSSDGTVYVTLDEAVLAEWKAGNLIPADEVEARIAEAVAGERRRCAQIADRHQYTWEGDAYDRRQAMMDDNLACAKASAAQYIAAAIRGDDHDG